MGETPNHQYNVPEPGTQSWHEALNENFEDFDTDIEVRDAGEPTEHDELEPTDGATYVDTDTGIVWEADGSDWAPNMALGMYEDDNGTASVVFGSDYVQFGGDIEATGTKHFVQAVDTPAGEREVVYTAAESPVPRTEASGVATLEDGRAEIDLPAHFSWVTSTEEPLHVQTTPYSVDAAGLAVVERSVERIVVADRSGTGEYEFSYTVRGTREGYEDSAAVRVPEHRTSGHGNDASGAFGDD